MQNKAYIAEGLLNMIFNISGVIKFARVNIYLKHYEFKQYLKRLLPQTLAAEVLETNTRVINKN